MPSAAAESCSRGVRAFPESFLRTVCSLSRLCFVYAVLLDFAAKPHYTGLIFPPPAAAEQAVALCRLPRLGCCASARMSASICVGCGGHVFMYTRFSGAPYRQLSQTKCRLRCGAVQTPNRHVGGGILLGRLPRQVGSTHWACLSRPRARASLDIVCAEFNIGFSCYSLLFFVWVFLAHCGGIARVPTNLRVHLLVL